MKKASLIFIFITIAIDMIGIGIIIPTLPDIMRRFSSDQSEVSQLFGLFISVYAFMQFLASPLLGALSDLFGRRPILLNSLLIAAIDYLFMAFAPTLPLLFVGRILAGTTGASMTVAMAYIADISTKENRSTNFGMIGAAFGVGFIIGPAIGGLIGHWGPQYPFIVAAILNLINFLFGLFILPESLPLEKRRKFAISQLNPFKSIKKILLLQGLFPLFAALFFFVLAGQTHPSIWTLYTEFRFQWTPQQVGTSLAVIGIASAIAQGFLTRLIIPRWKEYKTVVICAAVQFLGFIAWGTANQGWMMFVILILTFWSWVFGPALQSLISSQAPNGEQGELQGSVVSIQSLAAILNPIITTQLFSRFTNPNSSIIIPGAPYYFAAAMCLIGLIIILTSKISSEQKTS